MFGFILSRHQEQTAMAMAAANASDRPAPNDITPEMIEAGLSPLYAYHRERNDEREIVCEIYRAMYKSRPR